MLTVQQIRLSGGLCNKLFCLFSACDIAIKKKVPILEPYFGWKSPILFSDIYDIDVFNEKMRKVNNGENIMIRYQARSKYKILSTKDDLWKYSEDILKIQRNTKTIDMNCMMIQVLSCLKLNPQNQIKLNSLIPNLHQARGLHIRIESDWVRYNRVMKVDSDETLLIHLNELIAMYKKTFICETDSSGSDQNIPKRICSSCERILPITTFSTKQVKAKATKRRCSSCVSGIPPETIFFTTGENQEHIQNQLKSVYIKSEYYFDNNQEYEINAAINFEACCMTKEFIGLSRSTFSNLISLKRHLIGKHKSYIYNYKNEIFERKDDGLFPNAKNAITDSVIYKNN